MTRKISEDAATAFCQGKPFRRSNTQVEERDGYWYLVLHGNCIARYTIGGYWGDSSEVNTHGWDGPVTHDRLNALPGVSVHGYQDVWLNGMPWERSYEWTKLDPELRREPCKGAEAEYREAALAWIEAHQAPRTCKEQRTRKGSPILMYTCETQWGTHIEVFCRPWAAEPAGEIHVEGHKRMHFRTWEAFGPVCDKAQELAGPELYQLEKEAGRILEGK